MGILPVVRRDGVMGTMLPSAVRGRPRRETANDSV